MGRKRNSEGAPKSVAEVQTKVEAQAQQLAALVAEGDRKVKAVVQAHSNNIFAKAQAAFESCESYNQQSEEQQAKLGARHATNKKALAATRQKLSKMVQGASALPELQEAREQLGELLEGLRSKMVVVKERGQKQKQQQGQGQGQQKRRKSVTFQQRAAA